jgi:cellobiose-specific phosphotransferase system component IIC
MLQTRRMHRLGPLGLVAIVNVVLGVPAYFVSFLFAYGFEDSVHVGNHVAFLVMIAIFATVTGLLSTFTKGDRPFARRASVGVLASLALNSAVVGAGSIVSAAHKDDGSVSAAFSTQTDVLVATGLFVVACACAAAALRAARRPDERVPR